MFCVAIEQHLTLIAPIDYNHNFKAHIFLFYIPCRQSPCMQRTLTLRVRVCDLSACSVCSDFTHCSYFLCEGFFFFSVHSSGLRLASLSQRSLCRTPATVCRAGMCSPPLPPLFYSSSLLWPAFTGARHSHSQPALAAKCASARVCRLFVQSAK